MITEDYFKDLMKDLFSEYLPKVKAGERNEFIAALLDELQANDFEFEEATEEQPDRESLFDPYSDE